MSGDRVSREYRWFIWIIKIGVIGFCCLNVSFLLNNLRPTNDTGDTDKELSKSNRLSRTGEFDDLLRFLGANESLLSSNESEIISPEVNETEYTGTNYKFIAFTKSFAEAHETRKFLREKSWLSYNWTKQDGSEISWRHFFLVGLSLDTEANENLKVENDTFGDILMSNTFTFHRHQTYKIMWMLKYAVKNLNYKFLIQLDDDTIANVRLLDTYLTKLLRDGKDKDLYIGANCGKKAALRDGIFRTSEDVWPEPVYPSYCCGAGVIYSNDVIERLVNVWKSYRQPVVGHDDVQIGILAHIAGGIVASDVEYGIRLGYTVGHDEDFLLLAIRPLEIGAGLLKNYLETGVYGNESIGWHG